MTVMAQSFWIGVAGVAVALPIIFFFASFGEDIGAKILSPGSWSRCRRCDHGHGAMSGLFALRSLRMIEPVTLLR